MTTFEWDERKNLSNLQKHGITFEEASTVFEDPQAISQLNSLVDGEERGKSPAYSGVSCFSL